MRILLFGDGAWAAESLLALHAANHSVAAVVVRKHPSDSSLLQTASALRLPILQPDKANEREFIRTVKSFSPDLCVSISYNQILRQPLISVAPLGFINFHAGKLPSYRGRNVINWAIINGEVEIGLTAHFIDEGIDTGDIILQRTFPIEWHDTYRQILDRIVYAFPEFVVEAIERAGSGECGRTRQPQSAGTYFCGREDGDEWLDWSDTSLNLYNKVRAITRPGPGAITLLGDQTVIVWRAAYDRPWPSYIATPGQVVGRRAEGVVVKTGDSTLIVREVQIGGGPSEQPAWRIGTRLGFNSYAAITSLQARVRELERRL